MNIQAMQMINTWMERGRKAIRAQKWLEWVRLNVKPGDCVGHSRTVTLAIINKEGMPDGRVDSAEFLCAALDQHWPAILESARTMAQAIEKSAAEQIQKNAEQL